MCYSMEKPEKKPERAMKAYKLIKSYSALPTIEQQFEASLIIRRFITQVNSGQFNLFLQLGLISSFTFSLYDFLSLHHS